MRSLGLRRLATGAALPSPPFVLLVLAAATDAAATGGLISETDTVFTTGVGAAAGANVLLVTAVVALAAIYAAMDDVGGDDAMGVANALALALSAATIPTIPPRNTSNKELPPDDDDVVDAFCAATGTDGCAAGAFIAGVANAAGAGGCADTAGGGCNGCGGTTFALFLLIDNGNGDGDGDGDGDVG